MMVVMEGCTKNKKIKEVATVHLKEIFFRVSFLSLMRQTREMSRMIKPGPIMKTISLT